MFVRLEQWTREWDHDAHKAETALFDFTQCRHPRMMSSEYEMTPMSESWDKLRAVGSNSARCIELRRIFEIDPDDGTKENPWTALDPPTATTTAKVVSKMQAWSGKRKGVWVPMPEHQLRQHNFECDHA